MENLSISPYHVLYRILLCLLLVFPFAAPYLNAQSSAAPLYAPPRVPTLQEQKIQQEQRNREYLRQIGHTVPPTQEEIIASQQNRSSAPLLTPPQIALQQELTNLLRETQHHYTWTTGQDYYHTPAYLEDLQRYEEARDRIQAMLNGSRSLSVKDAFYLTEAAYGRLHLSYQEFNTIIQANTDFIRQWLTENGYPLRDPEALHYGIQKFMSDTLFISVNGKKQGHIPYYYDFVDAAAREDRRNYFVTKTLATGSGQCHTFPITYLILAEALGAEAYLAYNPKHSFIRFRNNQGTLINYETTVDRFLPDAFYLETLPVMAEARRNHLYVNELNRKQVIASALFDLAVYFTQEHWLSDKTFIQSCIDLAQPHFPNPLFVNGHQSYLHKRLLAEELNTRIREKGIRYLSEIEQYPDVKSAYLQYYRYMENLSRLGIQDLPESEYLRMLAYYDDKSRLQIARKVSAKSKKSLFIDP